METPTDTSGHDGDPESGFNGAAWPVVLWSGWAFAFSPILLDLAAHLRVLPWTRATLVFPFLTWWSSRNGSFSVRESRWGWALVGVGLLIGLLAVAGDVLRWGRIGLVLAAVGLCLGAGWIPWRAAILLFWSVPVPHLLLDLAEPFTLGFFLPGAVWVARGMGATLESRSDQLVSAAGSLQWSVIDGGLALAIMAAGLGWFHAIECRSATGKALRSCLGAAAFALVVQWGIVLSVGLAFARGETPVALRALLDRIPWFGIWMAAFLLVWRDRRLIPTPSSVVHR